METAVEHSPLLQTNRMDDERFQWLRWGRDEWQSIPLVWQPASDPDDEWMEAELTTGS